jgi:hypothetical protein
VKKSEVPGVQFGKSTTDRPDLCGVIPTELGPGDYDVTAWERWVVLVACCLLLVETVACCSFYN